MSSLIRDINPTFSTAIPDFVHEYDVEENGYDLSVGPPLGCEQFGDPDSRTRDWIPIDEVVGVVDADAEYDEYIERFERDFDLEDEELDRELFDGGGEYQRYHVGNDTWSNDIPPSGKDEVWEDLENGEVKKAGMRKLAHNIRNKKHDVEMRLDYRRMFGNAGKRKRATLRSNREGKKNPALLRCRARIAQKRNKVVKRGVRERGCTRSPHVAELAEIRKVAERASSVLREPKTRERRGTTANRLRWVA